MVAKDHSRIEVRGQTDKLAITTAIRWLSGKTETFAKVDAGQIVTVQEGKGIVRKQPYTR